MNASVKWVIISSGNGCSPLPQAITCLIKIKYLIDAAWYAIIGFSVPAIHF